MKPTIALAVATVVAAIGITSGSAFGADGGKKPLSAQDAIALVNKMVAAGKIDQATADKKIQAIQNGK